ncbi:MAG: coenzyme F420 hydrogenase, partial [Hyphomicrobium sp.]
VRNQRGEDLLSLLGEEVRISEPRSAGSRKKAVKGFLANTVRAAGGLPLRSMPNWLRPIIGWLMPKIGPRGLEFARSRIEMKAIETVLFLRQKYPRRMRSMVPPHIWSLVAPYGLTPRIEELPLHREAKPLEEIGKN